MPPIGASVAVSPPTLEYLPLPLQERALAITETALGPDRPSTAMLRGPSSRLNR